jgi:hypothetical protein
MKASTVLVFILTSSAPCLLTNDAAPQVGQPQLPKRDLTLIANEASFPPSPADIVMIKIRILQAEHAAAVARIAAIEARIRQIREEGESRIKALSDEREALARREKELSEALETARPLCLVSRSFPRDSVLDRVESRDVSQEASLFPARDHSAELFRNILRGRVRGDTVAVRDLRDDPGEIRRLLFTRKKG